MIGLGWLVSLVCKLKCFDVNTIARKRLVYAKALIKITRDRPLPSKLRVFPTSGHMTTIDVHYSWKPDIRKMCCSFGHMANAYKHGPSNTSPMVVDMPLSFSAKDPLPRPTTRKWVSKQRPIEVVDLVVPVASSIISPSVIYSVACW